MSLPPKRRLYGCCSQVAMYREGASGGQETWYWVNWPQGFWPEKCRKYIMSPTMMVENPTALPGNGISNWWPWEQSSEELFLLCIGYSRPSKVLNYCVGARFCHQIPFLGLTKRKMQVDQLGTETTMILLQKGNRSQRQLSFIWTWPRLDAAYDNLLEKIKLALRWVLVWVDND